MDDKTKVKYVTLLNIQFKNDVPLRNSLESFLDVPGADNLSIEKVFRLVETYNFRRICYAAQGDTLPEAKKREYNALRLLRKSILQREIGFYELKNHLEGNDTLC